MGIHAIKLPDVGEGVAEDGNTSALGSSIASRTGVTSPLAPGVYGIHYDQKVLFTFLHVAESREEVLRSGALEAAVWFMNVSDVLEVRSHSAHKCSIFFCCTATWRVGIRSRGLT